MITSDNQEARIAVRRRAAASPHDAKHSASLRRPIDDRNDAGPIRNTSAPALTTRRSAIADGVIRLRPALYAFRGMSSIRDALRASSLFRYSFPRLPTASSAAARTSSISACSRSKAKRTFLGGCQLATGLHGSRAG